MRMPLIDRVLGVRSVDLDVSLHPGMDRADVMQTGAGGCRDPAGDGLIPPLEQGIADPIEAPLAAVVVFELEVAESERRPPRAVNASRALPSSRILTSPGSTTWLPIATGMDATSSAMGLTARMRPSAIGSSTETPRRAFSTSALVVGDHL
jgi:hypothetical protein